MSKEAQVQKQADGRWQRIKQLGNVTPLSPCESRADELLATHSDIAGEAA